MSDLDNWVSDTVSMFNDWSTRNSIDSISDSISAANVSRENDAMLARDMQQQMLDQQRQLADRQHWDAVRLRDILDPIDYSKPAGEWSVASLLQLSILKWAIGPAAVLLAGIFIHPFIGLVGAVYYSVQCIKEVLNGTRSKDAGYLSRFKKRLSKGTQVPRHKDARFR